MSNPSFAAEQLLELLLQLKKTTPAAARSILNSQPQIAYALMTLMVNMNAINVEVFQKILAEYGNSNRLIPAAPAAQQIPTPPTATTYSSSSSMSAIPVPSHLPPHPYPTSTPPSTTPTPSIAPPAPQYPSPSYANGWNQQSYSQSQSSTYAAQTTNTDYGYTQPSTGYSYAAPVTTVATSAYDATQSVPQAQSQAQPAVTEMLAAMPDDQKALIMRVITMPSEQINALPPTERQAYIQLRATLGVPTD